MQPFCNGGTIMARFRNATHALGLLGLVALAGAAAAAGPAQAAPKTEAAGHRTRVLRSWPEDVRWRGRTLPARVEVVFDYTDGVAIERLVAETKDGRQVLKTQTFPPGVGVPAPSVEEIEEAKQIVRGDEELSRLIRNADAVLDGGFEIFEPAGGACGPGTRCIKIQISTDNGLGLIRNVVVDLTKQGIAHRAWLPEWSGGKK
jgi:hypothetical protein